MAMVSSTPRDLSPIAKTAYMWCPPPLRWVCLNTDGSIYSSTYYASLRNLGQRCTLEFFCTHPKHSFVMSTCMGSKNHVADHLTKLISFS
ncbi:hypothetical protein V6N12_007470 [Hibiscus sabdariffa]|uniref:Uncharacterized protein n=1 Tax=Hibiscus sabdariffa TaxID=183260 RepID=A0ABR2F1V6_9ROSI